MFVYQRVYCGFKRISFKVNTSISDKQMENPVQKQGLGLFVIMEKDQLNREVGYILQWEND